MYDDNMYKLLYFLFMSAFVMANDSNPEEMLHAGNNRITGNMLFEVAKTNPGRNLIISAFSVITPLAQLALASVGPSHDELLNSLGFPNDDVTKAVFSVMDKKLKTVPGIELKTANKMYIPLKYEVNHKFAVVSRDVFHSEIANVNFTKNEETAKDINAWVEAQTNHRIKDLITPRTLGSETKAVLVNAIYFKGTWLTRFEKKFTQEGNFHVSKEKVAKIPMMHNKADYKYGESRVLKSKILEMLYIGEKSSMLIVLPNEINGIRYLLNNLKDLRVLDKETKNLKKVEVKVSIPKFKIETTTDLKQTLQRMNVTKVFSPTEAKLDKLLMATKDLYVSAATQKAFIEVNEEGVEAAAANGSEMGISAPSAKLQYEFIADHPFMFFLKINKNILFSGIYYAQ